MITAESSGTQEPCVSEQDPYNPNQQTPLPFRQGGRGNDGVLTVCVYELIDILAAITGRRRSETRTRWVNLCHYPSTLVGVIIAEASRLNHENKRLRKDVIRLTRKVEDLAQTIIEDEQSLSMREIEDDRM